MLDGDNSSFQETALLSVENLADLLLSTKYQQLTSLHPIIFCTPCHFDKHKCPPSFQMPSGESRKALVKSLNAFSVKKWVRWGSERWNDLRSLLENDPGINCFLILHTVLFPEQNSTVLWCTCSWITVGRGPNCREESTCGKSSVFFVTTYCYAVSSQASSPWKIPLLLITFETSKG